MKTSSNIFRKEIIGWSLYDFANTIYSMNILSLYFKRWIVEDLGRDGLYYDISYSLSMLLAGLIMPALGAVSDHSAKKKLFLFLFTITCCLSVGLLSVLPAALLISVIILFGLSNFFYEGGMVFYNSLLYSVSGGMEARLVSGFGVAVGYTGSIVGMILVLPFVTGDLFGINIAFIEGGGKVGSFLPTAVLFALFSIPLFLWVREKPALIKPDKINVGKAYREVWEGIKDTRKYPGVMRFLIADYFFEDAVATVILNIGIFSSMVLAFTSSDLSIFLIISTVSAMVGSFIIGKISQNTSLKKLMASIIIGWIITLVCFIFAENRIFVYIMGSAVGVLLGGLWTVSRPLLAEMVPKDELGRFFGLYSLSGRAAAVVGPVIWGLAVYIFNPNRAVGRVAADILELTGDAADKLPYRVAVATLIIMMAFGLFIFKKLPENKRN